MSKQNSSAKSNRLSRESSPYLLQHASNPVDWFPWGDEAFEKARSEDKPAFLSIGYSACHWCHVMAQECFEDNEVASLMNENFISIKVDREEMPHIDHIYMQACQVLTGSGGWPLSVIMTPEKQPFFAATYLPKHTRQGLMGMMELIPLISRLWQEKREEVIREASHISRLIKQSTLVRPGDDLNEQLLSRAYGELKERFSTLHGGFGPAPKFPSPQNIMFLLRYYRRTGDQEALGMAVKTLASMRTGGIYDHVGYGFHRYSTDEQWLVPHFEKMLYDQALLAIAYTEAFQVTQREDFRKTAEDIISYVLRDMHTEEGLFASAQDADSEGEEGRFYLWNTAEIRSVLDDDDYALALEAFGLRDEGNFTESTKRGLNIIHLAQDEAGLAERLGFGNGELADRLARILENLRRARAARKAPMKDYKVLADWNGLMIAALAKAGAALGKHEFTKAAKTAADFILDNMLMDNKLRHVYMAGTAHLQAYLDDYAFFIWGLIELYEATFESRYLKSAIDLNTVLLDDFQDHNDGGFYSTSVNDEVPIVRAKTAYDNAYPSGNSVVMLNLLRLAGLTGNRGLRDPASRAGKAFSSLISRLPSAFTFMMCGLDYLTGPNYEVVIAGDPAHEDTKEMIQSLRSCFLPHAVTLLKHDENSGPCASIMQDKNPLDGKATAYVCSATSCLEPTVVVSKMLECLR